MQEQLNSFHMFTWKVVYYYCLKSGTKWFWINNDDLPFSTLHYMAIWLVDQQYDLCVIFPPCSTKVKKTEVILWCGWLFLALLKLIKRHMLAGFSLMVEMGGAAPSTPPSAKNLCYNALKTFFLAVVIAHVPFLS